MPDFDRNELKILEHFEGDWKQLKTLKELPKSTLYRKKDKLKEDGLIDEKPRESEPGSLYKTSEEGIRALENSESELGGIPQAEPAPTPEHQAMIELILAAVASRQTELKTDHHPTFVQVGGTLKWKSWLAKFTSYLLDLNPKDSVILMSSESGRSLLTRKGYAGETISQRGILDMPFVCFDEYHEAGGEQRKLCRVYLQGRTTVPYENQELEIEPVPLLNLNPQGSGTIREKTGLEERQVRRSIICDLDQVEIPNSKKTRGEEVLKKAKEETITIPDQVPDLSTYRNQIQKTIDECVKEKYTDLVDLEMLILLASGMSSFMDERDAVTRTVRNYLQVVETLGWTEEGWPRNIDLRADEFEGKTGEEEKKRTPSSQPQALAQQALTNSESSESSPFDYSAKLAKLKEKLKSYGLESDKAFTILSEVSRKCDEEGIKVAEAVEEILNLLDRHESVESAVQSKEKKLSETKKKLKQDREKKSGLESEIEEIEEEIAELEEKRDDTEKKLKYASGQLADLDGMLQNVGVSPDEVEHFIEKQKTLDELSFSRKEAVAVAKELSGGGDLEERLKKITELVEEYGSLEEAHSKSKKKLGSLKGSISSLENRLEEKKVEYGDIKEKEESREEKVEELETKWAELKEEIAELKEEKKNAEEELQRTLKTKKRGKEIAEDLDKLESLEELISSKEEKINTMKNRKEDLEEQIEERKDTLERLDEGIEDLKGLKEKINSLEGKKEELESKVEKEYNELEEYQELVEKADEKKEKIEKELEEFEERQTILKFIQNPEKMNRRKVTEVLDPLIEAIRRWKKNADIGPLNERSIKKGLEALEEEVDK